MIVGQAEVPAKPHTSWSRTGPHVPAFRPYPAKSDRSYLASYCLPTATLGPRHERIADAVWHIPGWLLPEDALKLYELAYFADGPILEIGTFCGRSAVVMCTAVADRGSGVPVVSVDIDPATTQLARRAAAAHGVEDGLLLFCGRSRTLLQTFPRLEPALVFIDGDHSFAGVREDLDALAAHVRAGTLLLFHDYVPTDVPDTHGFPVSPHPIEVADALAESWLAERASFAGVFGCSALFRVETEALD